MANDKVVQFTRCKETAADVHWNTIDDAARYWAHAATLLNKAIPGSEDDESADPSESTKLNDIAKSLCADLIRNVGGIMNLQRDLITWGWRASCDDSIETLARVSANLLKSHEWRLAIPSNFTDELSRQIDIVVSTAQARRLSRQEVQREQRQAI